MGLFTICLFWIVSFQAICNGKALPREREEPTSVLGRFGGLEPQGVAGTGILSSTIDKNGKDNRNVVRALETGVAGSGTLTKTTNDANVKLSKDDEIEGTTEDPDEGLVEDRDELPPPPRSKPKNKNGRPRTDVDDDADRQSRPKNKNSSRRRENNKKKSKSNRNDRN